MSDQKIDDQNITKYLQLEYYSIPIEIFEFYDETKGWGCAKISK